jgi:hypothetical protein
MDFQSLVSRVPLAPFGTNVAYERAKQLMDYLLTQSRNDDEQLYLDALSLFVHHYLEEHGDPDLQEAGVDGEGPGKGPLKRRRLGPS